MNQEKINRNSVVTQVISGICNDCKTCEVSAIDNESGKKVKVKSSYCSNGSGYISIDLYDENGKYLDCAKLKHPTDPCSLPFNLKVDSEPDCGCIN